LISNDPGDRPRDDRYHPPRLRPQGRIAGRAYSESEQYFPRPGWVEHDATEIWEVTRWVASEALGNAGIQGCDLAGIGITNQRETAYALEAAVFVTGAAVQWLRDGLGIIREAAETEGLAASLEGNDGVYFVPALTASVHPTGIRTRGARSSG
jgi:glycerol kinase